VLGIAIEIYAFTMNVSLPGADVVNIHLLSQRQNATIVGGVLFLAGIILYAVYSIKQTNNDNKKIEHGKILYVCTERLREFVGQKNQGEKYIITSAIFVVFSMMLGWKISTYFDKAVKPDMSDVMVMTSFWLYPVYAILTKNRLRYECLAFFSLCATILNALNFYDYIKYNEYGYGHMGHTRIGLGMYLAIIASIVYMIGANMIKSREVAASDLQLINHDNGIEENQSYNVAISSKSASFVHIIIKIMIGIFIGYNTSTYIMAFLVYVIGMFKYLTDIHNICYSIFISMFIIIMNHSIMFYRALIKSVAISIALIMLPLISMLFVFMPSIQKQGVDSVNVISSYYYPIVLSLFVAYHFVFRRVRASTA
jgi:hypothetical protein